MKTNTTLLFGLFLCLTLSFTTQIQAQNLNVEGNATAAKFIGDGSMLTNIDKDTLNELQALMLNGDTLMLSKDTTNVDLSAFINNWIINDGRDVAFGYNNLAIGLESSAFGILNDAAAPQSNAFGYLNTAAGLESSAFGYLNSATGSQSNAFGYSNQAPAPKSSALGYNNDATQVESSALGYNNMATAEKSSAFGHSNQATGLESSAFGYDNTATGDRSNVFGHLNEGSGDNSSAFGDFNQATALRTSAIGYANDATGSTSSAFGYFNEASGGNSSAFGQANDATGARSSAFGFFNEATAANSSALGHYALSDVYALMAVGHYNADPVGSKISWIPTEPVFVIGNGANSNNRSTAVTVLKNGDVGIGTQNPSEKLEVSSDDANVTRIGVTNTSTGNATLRAKTVNSDYGWYSTGTDNTFRLFDFNANLDRMIVDDMGNVGIGTTSPNVKLQITGGTNAFNSGGGYIINGEVNDLNLALDNNEIVARNNGAPSNLFIQNPGGNTILNGSNGGNVGIGITSPTQKLHVAGEGLVNSTSSDPTFVIQNDTEKADLLLKRGAATGGIQLNASGGALGLTGAAGGANLIQFRTYGASYFNGGNLGIGTDNPQTKLHIEGGSDTAPAGGGYLVTGNITGLNISIDNNEIMARNNGGTADLSLQNEGGNTIIASGVNGQNVGIGTTSPLEKLEIIGNVKATKFIGDGSLLTNVDQQDLSLSGETLNLSNDATPVDLRAFINNWTIDDRDIAFGYNNLATGNFSSAFGRSNSAIGASSSAFGRSNSAIGDFSSAFGRSNDATEANSSAFGFSNEATGVNSSAFGRSNEATEANSSAFGFSNEATGENSSAFGRSNDATGENSSAFGYANDATAEESSAFGFSALSDVYGLMAVGRYNADPVGSATSWVATDPVFVIGNGQGSSTRSTAVTVLKNGNVGIGTTTPSQKLDVDGRARIRNLPVGGTRTVLVDASGNLFQSSFSPNVNASDIGLLREDIESKTQTIQDLQLQLEEVKNENLLLEKRLAKIEALLSGKQENVSGTTSTLSSVNLSQNAPNPFDEVTRIDYFIPEQVKSASLQVLDQNGRIIKTIPIQATGKGQITLQTNLLSAGTYSYSLVLDGQVMETKQMVLTH